MADTTKCIHCGKTEMEHSALNKCLNNNVPRQFLGTSFTPLKVERAKTVLRYEVWASVTGASTDWKLVPQGMYVGGSADNELNKHRAIERAEKLAETNGKVCVEEWDDGRNVFLKTVREFPNI